MWKPSTSGTPSDSAFAVTVISGIPPGDMPSAISASGRPEMRLRPIPSTAITTISSSDMATEAKAKRWEDSRKRRLIRWPSAIPMPTCAASTIQPGTPDGRMPSVESRIIIPQGASIQGLAMPKRRAASATPKPPASSGSRPRPRTGGNSARKASAVPSGASQPTSGGTSATTSITRIVCASVTVGTERPARCASTAITTTPPGTAA